MWLARVRRRRAERPDLCLLCGSDFVHPVRWHEAGDDSMWVQLRCGECDSWREEAISGDELDRFDRKLDHASELIAKAADRLHREWRAIEAETFAAALDRDLIDAGDFD